MIRQWEEVEAAMAAEYGCSTADLFTMTWRRFRVLFSKIFVWKSEGDSTAPTVPTPSKPAAKKYDTGRIADTVDWWKLTGSEKPSEVRTIGVKEFVDRWS